MGLGRLNPFRIVKDVTGVDLIDTARKITGGTAGAVEDVAQKLGNTVEAIASDPRKLAAVGIMVAFPGAAGSVGQFLLPEAAAASLGAAGTAIVGQTAINTALNGGDLDAAVKAALVQQGLPAVTNSVAASQLGKDMQEIFGKYGAQAATQAGLAAIMGKDPVAAFVFSGAKDAVGLITKEIPGWSDLPAAAQKSINSALLANLTGKDAATAAASSLVGSAINAGKDYATIQSKLEPTGKMLTAEQLAEIPIERTSYVAMANPKSVENISKYLDMADKGDITFRGGDLTFLGSTPSANVDWLDKRETTQSEFNDLIKQKLGSDWDFEKYQNFVKGTNFADKGIWGGTEDMAAMYLDRVKSGVDKNFDTYADAAQAALYGPDKDAAWYYKRFGGWDSLEDRNAAKALGITNSNDYALYLEQQAKTQQDQGIGQLAQTQQEIVPPVQQPTGGIEQLAQTQEPLTPTEQETQQAQNTQEVPTGIDQLIQAQAPAGPPKPVLNDVLTALKVSLGKLPFDAKYDVDGDGEVTQNDVLGLQKAVLNKDPGFNFVSSVFSAPAHVAPVEVASQTPEPPAPAGIEQLAQNQEPLPPVAQTQEPPAPAGIEQLAQNQEPVAPPTQQLTQETTAGLDQLVNAINNPETTSSYTGTNVADVGPGITGLPAGQPTEQDLEQLGVGLPTGLTDTTDQAGVDVPGNGYVAPDQTAQPPAGIDTLLTPGTVVSDQPTGDTGMDDFDLGGFDGIDMTGGQDDTYQAGNDEEENISTIPVDAGQGEGAFPGTEPGTVASDQPGGITGLTPSMWEKLATATGLSPTTLKLLGAGLGAAGLGSLFGQQQQAPAPTPYTGPLSNVVFNPATYTPYTYKPYAGGGAVEQMSNLNAVGGNTGFPMADIQRGAYATPYQQPISQNVVTGAQDTRVDPYTGEERLAMGGIANLGGYSDGGRLLRGPGDGVSDSIPAVIGGKQPARLADGEFVIPARIVSELGNGSTEAGARQLYAMMDRIQAARRKTVGKDKVAANTKAAKHLPA